MTVDVVSMDSETCDLENLGALSDMSGGTVTKVKASELASNFAGILANPILASQVLTGTGYFGCDLRRIGRAGGWVGARGIGHIEVCFGAILRLRTSFLTILE